MTRKHLQEYMEKQHTILIDYFDNITNNTISSNAQKMMINSYKLTIINVFSRKEKTYSNDNSLEEHIKNTIIKEKENLNKAITIINEDLTSDTTHYDTNVSYITVNISMHESFLKELKKGFTRDFRKISDDTYVVPMRRSAITGKYIT